MNPDDLFEGVLLGGALGMLYLAWKVHDASVRGMVVGIMFSGFFFAILGVWRRWIRNGGVSEA